ncbi:hypothetical protein O181_004225 [Austropuccinia psidii MF-1]|uniref:Uncharacterized protein n=1 Tax=Austropuccinia psidii MF-1 TaxID=1389203 RepID=A0A9Q3BFZ1_9BASI|nr:hypothetical protein [Austropuccinia psidii MF-1]
MTHQPRSPPNSENLVLAYNKAQESNWGLLFKNKFKGPYRVIRQVTNGPCKLEELDGTKLLRRFAPSQVKWFYPRGQLIYTNKDTEDEPRKEEEVFEETIEADE